jgi:hypothetical protein
LAIERTARVWTQPFEVRDPSIGAHPGAQQRKWELDSLLAIYVAKQSFPFNVLEIGTADGGTLRQWMGLLSIPAVVVSVDSGVAGFSLPDGHEGWFSVDGCTLRVIKGDSKSDGVRRQVDDFAPYGWVFIDGDHSYRGVRADWEYVLSCAAFGATIALHDILNLTEYGDDPGVPGLWEEIQSQGFVTQELIADPSLEGRGCGIGVVYL